ncbi:MAG: response regulator [Planctomycetes bacterium]|nr:response regulator [Planctomycetota bacterium]
MINGTDDLKHLYRQGMAARIDALEAARKSLEKQGTPAVESIRRIAHSLRGSGGSFGFPEVTEAAGALEDAPDGEILSRLEKLLDVLREIASGGDAETTKVLIIDDDPESTLLLRAVLSRPGREILAAETAAKAESILADTRVSLILLDLVLPDTDGRNLLVRLRSRPATAAVPIVVLSALSGSQPKTECFALGADDVLEKPFNPETLSASLAARLHRSAVQLRESRRDALTGLPNRAAFCESFLSAVSLAARHREALSIGIADLDYFKSVNDSYGHATGDRVLRQAASLFSKTLRKSDIVARWGGEEFVILFPITQQEGAVRALEKTLDAFRAEAFQLEDGRAFQVTFSAGVVPVTADSSVEEAVKEADRFLYLAKGAGRNCILPSEGQIPSVRRTILLVEDDEVTAALIRHRLGREGMEVLHQSDGSEAVTVAAQISPSLVILDVKVPGLDGFGVLRRLRLMPSYAGVPIVMLTSLGNERDISRGFSLGADDYILKPFSPVELVARVLRLLSRHSTPATSRDRAPASRW